MLRPDGYVEIQVFRRQERSLRAIGAQLGRSRSPVRNYLSSGPKADLPRSREAANRPPDAMKRWWRWHVRLVK